MSDVIITHPSYEFWCHIVYKKLGLYGLWGISDNDVLLVNIKGEVFFEPQTELYDATSLKNYELSQADIKEIKDILLKAHDDTPNYH